MKKLTVSALIALVSCLFSINAAAQTRGWGYNGNGQLGIGNQTNQPTPVTIPAAPDATGIGGGFYHTLFLKANGTLLGSGSNFYGQVGDGTSGNSRLSPVNVLNLTNVIQASAGAYHSTALLADGNVWSWGINSDGQIGNGTITIPGCQCIPTPTQTTISNVVQIDAGSQHTLALKSDGTVWAWGFNSQGQLGDNSETTRYTPVQIGVGISGFNNIIAISAGDFHSMALKADGTVWVWGRNGEGEVGNGTTGGNQLVPVQNTTLANVTQISAGAYHNIALLKDGTVRVWGINASGQVGNGISGGYQLTPVQTAGIGNVVEIETASNTNYVRLSDGTVRGWGYNNEGQIGSGTTTTTGCSCIPTPVTTSVGASNASIASGYNHAFALNPVIPVTPATNQTFRGDNLRLIFADITGAGNIAYTAVAASTVAANYTVPMGYVIQNNQPAYDVTSTAATSGNIDVCISGINEFDQTAFAYLKILHAEGTNWVDRTYTSTFRRRQICARVTTLSPFVIATGLAPNAATVSIGGRVTYGTRSFSTRATVTLTDASGNVKTALVNPFGYYKFGDVSVGQTVTLQVSAKGATFSPQAVTVTEDAEDVNFTAQ